MTLTKEDLDDLDEYLKEIEDEPMAYVWRETVIELSRIAREHLPAKKEEPPPCERCGLGTILVPFEDDSPAIVCPRCGYSWNARPIL